MVYPFATNKWPLSISNQCYGLAKFWEESGAHEGNGDVAENGPFLVAISVRNGVCQKCQIAQDLRPVISEEPLPIHFSPKNGPFDS